ncbi:MAG TPA: 50S ribosomal protein L18 [Acidimicrobiaceae bacterium]|nr:50S ribosomal protein L18 [Acidimicrobiaceae bacterium]HAX05514.1 50S ribosomal protein L18 [Acidimicrobiaceae bacterium]
MTSRSAQRQRRQRRVRKKITGTTSRPRLSVFRSNRHISAQIIDDENGRTVASASTSEADLRGLTTSNKEAAGKVGSLLATRAQEAGIDSVVFDRGGNKYHGRVAALADAARDAGLKF